MSEQERTIIGDWEVCPDCDGEEGYFDTEADEWVDCDTCEGSGGWGVNE